MEYFDTQAKIQQTLTILTLQQSKSNISYLRSRPRITLEGASPLIFAKFFFKKSGFKKNDLFHWGCRGKGVPSQQLFNNPTKVRSPVKK